MVKIKFLNDIYLLKNSDQVAIILKSTNPHILFSLFKMGKKKANNKQVVGGSLDSNDNEYYIIYIDHFSENERSHDEWYPYHEHVGFLSEAIKPKQENFEPNPIYGVNRRVWDCNLVKIKLLDCIS